MVRLTALRVCEAFLDDAEICGALSVKINYYLEHISHRFIDINPKITIKAINIFTKSLKT